MARSAPLDFEALLAPIAGDNQAGDPKAVVGFRDQFNELIREVDPDEYEADDPLRPPAKKADWPAVVQLAEQTLIRTSKDLEVAARLTLALTQLHQFAGLRDGLHLLQQLVEHCWDRLNPPASDGDASARADSLSNILDDPFSGTRFPTVVRLLPLVKGKTERERYGSVHLRPRPEDKVQVDQAALERAIQVAPVAECQKVAGEIAQSLEELQHLKLALEAKMASAAPALVHLREAVESCQLIMQDLLRQKCPPGAEKTDDTRDGRSVEGGTAPVPAALGSRKAIYEQLRRAADALGRLEPHSPIPYLIKRAVELGEMEFPKLMGALIRDLAVLKELYRELGIPQPSEEAPQTTS